MERTPDWYFVVAIVENKGDISVVVDCVDY